MKLIYIAGPYRPYTNAYGALVDTAQNISHAEVTAVHLVDELGHLGLFPVVPHLNTRDFENQVKQNNDQYFLDGTMALLERCDAVLLTMPDADVVSVGTKAEVHRAYQLGIQVYRSFDSLRRAAQENQIVRLPMPAAISMEKANRIREEFMRLHPEVRKVWEARGPLTIRDFSKLEDRVLATLPEFPVAAVNLRPGDTLSSGDVVNHTKHLGGSDR
ncbi:nucleoside 2-deoxyribosyltransferase [Klebsiella phage S9a]|nr:nucleoside 2-deoxyribosyltransferase [Klebsiella phage S9a]